MKLLFGLAMPIMALLIPLAGMGFMIYGVIKVFG